MWKVPEVVRLREAVVRLVERRFLWRWCGGMALLFVWGGGGMGIVSCLGVAVVLDETERRVLMKRPVIRFILLH